MRDKNNREFEGCLLCCVLVVVILVLFGIVGVTLGVWVYVFIGQYI